MLDTPLPVRPPLTRRDRMMLNWLNLRQQGLSYPLTWARNRIAWELKKRRGNEEDSARIGQHFHDTAIEAAFLESVAAYQVAPWAGPLTLFRPPQIGKWQVARDRLVDQHRHYLYPDNDWTKWAPEIEISEVPGDHDSMVLEPNVRVLAARMKTRLEAAEQTQTAPDQTPKPREAAE